MSINRELEKYDPYGFHQCVRQLSGERERDTRGLILEAIIPELTHKRYGKVGY